MTCDGNCEGHQIVARIWRMLGNPTYDELAGRSIYDLIEDLQKRAVPREPTDAMVTAGAAAFTNVRDIWRAMLDAAPKP